MNDKITFDDSQLGNIFYELLIEPECKWMVIIDGKRFETYNNKTTWKTVGDAKKALRVALEYRIKFRVKEKLMREQYIVSADAFRYPAYVNCWANFMQQLEDEGRIQYVKI